MVEYSFSSLSQLIFGAIAVAAVAFGVSQFIGKQWVETKFAERFSTITREHDSLVKKLALEIETLRAARKLQELDLSILPGTWERLEKAYNVAKSILRFGEFRIDVEHLNVFELDEIMGGMDWFQSEINRVKSVDGFVRQDEFDNIRFGYQVRRVKDHCKEFDSYVAANEIFYPAAMLAELKEIGALLQSVVSDKEKAGIRRKSTDAEAPLVLDEQLTARINAMAASIRKKLETHEAPPAS